MIWSRRDGNRADFGVVDYIGGCDHGASPIHLRGMARLKAEQRRGQLIDVATAIFAKLGYDAATTAAIADAAGVTEPVLYRHFKGKQDLFIAIVRAVSQHAMAEWTALSIDGSDAPRQLRTIARQFPAHLERLADAYRLIHGALAMSRDRKVLTVLREHYRSVAAFYVQLVRSGQAAGAFRKDLDPHVPAWQLINVGIGYSMIAQSLPGLEPIGADEMIDFILAALRR